MGAHALAPGFASVPSASAPLGEDRSRTARVPIGTETRPPGTGAEGASTTSPSPHSASGDDASAKRFQSFVEAHYDFVWRSLRGLGVAAESADDAAQHVFLVTARKMTTILPGAERAFLFGVVAGVAANARRSQAQRREREIADDTMLASAADPGRAPDAELERREQCAVLEAILEAMPDDLRVVFVLFELEGLTTVEIAELLSIPTGTAASRLRRAREDFQARIARRGAGR